jgi:transposase InsO family protein
VGWNLSHRCRTEDAFAAVEQSVLERLPEGSRQASVTLTTDNGTQFTSTRFIETLGRLGIDLTGFFCTRWNEREFT